MFDWLPNASLNYIYKHVFYKELCKNLAVKAT